VRKWRAHFSKHGEESEVWEIKTEDAMVVVDNENAKIGYKQFFGAGEEPSGCKIVWNDIGGNQMGLALMNKDLRNRKEDVDKEQQE